MFQEYISGSSYFSHKKTSTAHRSINIKIFPKFYEAFSQRRLCPVNVILISDYKILWILNYLNDSVSGILLLLGKISDPCASLRNKAVLSLFVLVFFVVNVYYFVLFESLVSASCHETNSY